MCVWVYCMCMYMYVICADMHHWFRIRILSILWRNCDTRDSVNCIRRYVVACLMVIPKRPSTSLISSMFSLSLVRASKMTLLCYHFVHRGDRTCVLCRVDIILNVIMRLLLCLTYRRYASLYYYIRFCLGCVHK